MSMYFSYVNSKGFDGCIKNVQFGSNNWDLKNNKAALGVVSGCPEQVCIKQYCFCEGGASLLELRVAAVYW